MQLTSRQVVTQFAHMLQEELFPLLQSSVGPLNGQMQLLASVISLAPLERMLGARRAATGRPAKDRAALATAFLAKAILNLPTTRCLICRLRVDEALRRFCGWSSIQALPHESKFSRAFAEFAATELPQQLHEAVIATTQNQRLIGHIARDATAIPARERFPETKQQQKQKKQKNKPSSGPSSSASAQAPRVLLPRPKLPRAVRVFSGSAIRNWPGCSASCRGNATSAQRRIVMETYSTGGATSFTWMLPTDKYRSARC